MLNFLLPYFYLKRLMFWLLKSFFIQINKSVAFSFKKKKQSYILVFTIGNN